MIVYLVRHGIAADIASSDDERPLTEEGRKKFSRAASCYAKVMQRPEVIISSPLLRARQTAEILAEALAVAPDEIEIDSHLHHSANPATIMTRLHTEALEEVDAVALVGHEPHLGSLLGLLLTGSQHTAIPMRKGMLAAVEVRAAHIMLGRLLCTLDQKSARSLSK